MSVKSYTQQLQDIARTFAKTHSPEYQLDDLVSWAIKTRRWSLAAQDTHKIARKQFHDALRTAKDGEGNRIFIDGQLEQLTFWADRRQASWQLRQSFIHQQGRRSDNFRASVIAMCETLNAERKTGEPEFHLAFADDEE